jgi:hypothetical protein
MLGSGSDKYPSPVHKILAGGIEESLSHCAALIDQNLPDIKVR